MHMSNESLLVILFVGLVAGWLAGQIVWGSGFGLIGDLIIVRFLRRRVCSSRRSAVLRKRRGNLHCTEPRAASSDYGDLLEVVAATLSTRHGRMGGKSARATASWPFAGRTVRLRAVLLAR